MKKFVSIALASIVAMLALAACGSSASSNDATASSAPTGSSASVAATDDVEITHDLGTITVSGTPQRVVVFDFGILDTIDALGLTPELAVAKTSLPSYLDKYNDEKYTDIGGLKEFDLEVINEFAPDLIIISGRQQDFYEDLSTIAPTLFISIDSSKYMDDFKRNVGWIGEIFGKTAEVDSHIADIESKIKAVQDTVAENEQNALIILTNDGSISAYGPGSRFGIIHDVFGVPAADTGIEVSTHGQEVNYEYIAETNPDMMFVVDRTVAVGGETEGTATLDNDLVNSTNAAKNGKIFMLNPDVWYLSGGGLQSVGMMCDDITAAVTTA